MLCKRPEIIDWLALDAECEPGWSLAWSRNEGAFLDIISYSFIKLCPRAGHATPQVHPPPPWEKWVWCHTAFQRTPELTGVSPTSLSPLGAILRDESAGCHSSSGCQPGSCCSFFCNTQDWRRAHWRLLPVCAWAGRECYCLYVVSHCGVVVSMSGREPCSDLHSINPDLSMQQTSVCALQSKGWDSQMSDGGSSAWLWVPIEAPLLLPFERAWYTYIKKGCIMLPSTPCIHAGEKQQGEVRLWYREFLFSSLTLGLILVMGHPLLLSLLFLSSLSWFALPFILPCCSFTTSFCCINRPHLCVFVMATYCTDGYS